MRFPRPRIIIGYVLLFFTLAFAYWVFGQASPSPFTGSEISKLRLLSSYKTALLAQQNFNAAQQAAQHALAEWNAATEQAVKEEKLAKGTTFQVDVNTDSVTVVPPRPEQAKKEAPAPTLPAPPTEKK
jgi:hypothetical protein